MINMIKLSIVILSSSTSLLRLETFGPPAFSSLLALSKAATALVLFLTFLDFLPKIKIRYPLIRKYRKKNSDMSCQRLVNNCLPVLDLSEGKGSSTKSESSDPEGVLVSSQFSGIIDLFLSTSGAFGSCKYSGRSICPFCFPKICRHILTIHIAFLIILISVYSKFYIQTFVAVFFPSGTFLPNHIIFFIYIIGYSVRMLFIHVIRTNGNHFDQ